MKLSSVINTDFEVTTLSYLQKLIIVMMNLNMKISKSEIARHMGVDIRAYIYIEEYRLFCLK